MKTYTGSPAAARRYVEADRGRADDYYLAEGTGVAERYVASPAGGVRRLAPLTADTYAAWVAGFDPDTGVPKGRLRNDERAVRFVEVIVNGPKSWSLAAELHPDISAAYDAAQDRAATQIIGWLAQHATTRVGGRGAQVQVPVQEIEAVTVRHYTSRAGDPHRHLHLQINARVFAEGQWRGLHTVGVRDSLDAINGIGHAAVMTDPQFRAALAGHGFTLDPGTGEVTQLAEFVGPFSARAAQIGRNIERYEADWRAANPDHEPGSVAWRAWDARAWADERPDKIVPRDGAELTQRWVAELRALGYQDGHIATQVHAFPVGRLDRDAAVEEVLSRLAARRSGWNTADVRGGVEQLIARRNIVTDTAVRRELAEDLTARTLAQCVPLTDRARVPEHIRAFSSGHVLDVEADIIERLAARANTPTDASEAHVISAGTNLDEAQRDVVAALGSDAQLLVIEGAAGAGKTTALAAARTVIEQHGGRLRVVTPTLKAARVAAKQIGGDTSSAAWLAYQHGYRWNENGTWTRLAAGTTDPETGVVFHGSRDAATLRRGDVLLVDEAGMLDQDTARALLTIADEHQARVALVGDRHQLPAVGRGGVLDLAARWATRESCLRLDAVHRFTRSEITAGGVAVSVADDEYAQLSLAMRTGIDVDAVFAALLARDQIRVHASDAECVAALAGDAVDALAAGIAAVIVADTNEQVAPLNAAIRERRVATGQVDDEHATSTNAGQRTGIGDRVATRRNDANLDVANRDTWTVRRVAPDGAITVTGEHGERTLPVGYARANVELAYASTVHGVQGDTTTTAHAVIGVHTSAASAYVGMTRGRDTNVAHLVADGVDDAREQWVALFSRDRADLGPGHAAQLAARYALTPAPASPPPTFAPDPFLLERLLGRLHASWSEQERAHEQVSHLQWRLECTQAEAAQYARAETVLAPLRAAMHTAWATADRAEQDAVGRRAALTERAEQLAAVLRGVWDADLPAADQAAAIIQAGAGRFGQHRARVRDAEHALDAWTVKWRPVVGDLDGGPGAIAARPIAFSSTVDRVREPLYAYAVARAEQDLPEHAARLHAASSARERADSAASAHYAAYTDLQARSSVPYHGYDTGAADRLPDLTDRVRAAQRRAANADDAVDQLIRDPILTRQADPAGLLDAARTSWTTEKQRAMSATSLRVAHRADLDHRLLHGREQSIPSHQPEHPGRGISR